MQVFYERFTGIVVAAKNTPVNHPGAVRVKLIGYTDDLEDDMQPWVYPMRSVCEKSPEPGTYVEVVCTSADRSFLRYIPGTSLGGYLSPEFRDAHPNMVVTEIGHVMLYDRAERAITETDPNTGYERKVDEFGRTTLSAPAGYSISDRSSVPHAPVLTADSINLMCGKPMGQGSAYMSVPTFKNVSFTGAQI
jgi:hypothetical protein